MIYNLNKNNIEISEQGQDCRGIQYKKVSLSPRMADLTNKQYGQLIALFPILRPGKTKKEWLCLCSCGNIKIVNAANLVNNHIHSCGCLRQKTCSNHISTINKERKINLTNKIINNLQIIEEDIELTKLHSINSSRYYWKCKCLNCGKIMSLRTDTLQDNKRAYCRFCNKTKSIGEIKIKTILEKHQIPFIEEKKFNTCIFPDTNAQARFDFYVDNKYLIEYDGSQHFRESKIEYYDFEKIKQHDYIKNLWCYQNNIPLIRIPYSHIDNICLEDLLLETTQYLMEYKDEKFTITSGKTSLYS